MSKLTYKVSYYVLYAMFAAILVVLGLFYFGGEMETPVVPDMSNPAYTETLMFLMYGLLGLTVLVTVIAFLIQFGMALKDNPVAAIKSLLGAVLLILVLVVTWSMGDGTPLELVGYDGNENTEFFLKLTDMFLYSLYFLIGAAIVAMLFSYIKRALS